MREAAHRSESVAGNAVCDAQARARGYACGRRGSPVGRRACDSISRPIRDNEERANDIEHQAPVAYDVVSNGRACRVVIERATSGHITGIGGLAPGALLGWGDPDVGAFKRIEIKDKTEIVSLIGDISTPNGKPYVHVHMVVASADGSTKAGHLLEAHIAPVGELTVVATSFAH